jgi:carbonic anhydrase
MKLLCRMPALWLAVAVWGGRLEAADSPAHPSPEMILEWLRFGNERHAAGKYVHWHQTIERRREVARQQRPRAVVLSCSDSRVPPEIVFDQGLGDLFVVRVLGNVAGDKEIASIEHAIIRFETPLVVVTGHQRCEAVEAALAGSAAPGHFGSLTASLSAAVARIRVVSGDRLEQASRANVEHVADQIRNSEPVIAGQARQGKIRVLGAYYNLDSGVVSWLTPAGH